MREFDSISCVCSLPLPQACLHMLGRIGRLAWCLGRLAMQATPAQMTVCPSGQRDGLGIHWVLPTGVRIPSLSFDGQFKNLKANRAVLRCPSQDACFAALHAWSSLLTSHAASRQTCATPVGFEPTQADPIGLAGQRFIWSAKVSTSAARQQCHLATPKPVSDDKGK